LKAGEKDVIVYADILIVLNLIVDYFLLLAAGAVIRKKPKFIRILLAASIGGLSSLYIFLPQSPVFVELILRIALCAVMTLMSFGFGTLKDYLRSTGIFFGITCLYAGIMTALWHIIKPRGMVINNSVVYFDISALTLIVCTVIFYLLFTILSGIFASNGKMAEYCSITIKAGENAVQFTAMLDTGNSVSDIFGNNEIIITDRKIAEKLFLQLDMQKNPSIKSRYRVVPLSTVSGTDMLEGFRCDGAVAYLGKETVNIKNPVIAVSKTAFDSGINGIVNPKIFRNAVYDNVSENKKIYK